MLVAALAVLLAATATAYNNGMARMPPLGLSTWCVDDLCGLIDKCNEEEIKSMADALHTEGLYDLGYKYILLDDCWADTSRDAQGRLQPNPEQFPSGMKALADYLHEKDLYMGLYTCVGTQTCHGGRPGSYGKWDIDAATFASWGIDMVKADNCHRPSNTTPHEVYTQFSQALNATGHPMLFALCEWGEDDVLSWGADVGQMYRVQMDHLPFWTFPDGAAGEGIGSGVKDIIEYMAQIVPSKYTQHYGWPDVDFAETLFLTLDYTDSRTEYSFWSLWSAPILVATDIRNMTSQKRTIVANPEVIALQQDELGIGGDRIANYTNGGQVWAKPLSNGDKAIILFNPTDHDSITVSVDFSHLPGWANKTTVALRDLWQRQDIGKFQLGYSATIKPHDVLLLRATPVN
jgi:alpha-galactosidase